MQPVQIDIRLHAPMTFANMIHRTVHTRMIGRLIRCVSIVSCMLARYVHHMRHMIMGHL